MIRPVRWWLHIVSLVGLTAMVAFHAYALDVTNDEAYSFFLLKTEYYRAMFGTANTHWLNSILMKIEMLVLGDNVFGWRLHSVVAFPFFCIGVYRVTGFIRNDALAIICYSLIVFNPYLLDWFALARGYALALTFQVWLLYYLFLLDEKRLLSNKYQSILFLLSALMLVSNLSYFYTFLGVLTVFLLHIFIHRINIFSNKNTLITATGFVVLLFGTIANLWFVRQNDASMYGGDEFVYSIFVTIWDSFFYLANYGVLEVTLAWLTMLVLLAFIAMSIMNFIKNKNITPTIIVSIILGILLLLNVSFHVLFDAPYLSRRTALQWWVPGWLLIFICTDDFSRRKVSSRLTAKVFSKGGLIGLGISVFLAIHLITQYHPHLAHEWRDAKHSKQIINDLYELKAENVGLNKYVLGVFSNYYRITDTRFSDVEYQHLPEKTLADCRVDKWQNIIDCDYIIISFDETMNCLRQNKISYEIVRQYDNHRIVRLFKNSTSTEH